MPNKPQDSAQGAPSLGDLRKEIDRIDEAMHQLLMERGEIINRLISVKKTQETGSAFRPAREADMMRRLVQRHKGILPLDTAESIWRVIIATFTHVQAPFSVHADLSAGDAPMRDSTRFHFGFTVPFATRLGAAGVVAAIAASRGDLGLVPATGASGAWWTASPWLIQTLCCPGCACSRVEVSASARTSVPPYSRRPVLATSPPRARAIAWKP